MEPKRRTSDQDENTSRVDWGSGTGSGPSGEVMEVMEASPPREFDDEEGQLGPDELSDPAEVVMNHEAKMHR